MNAVIIEDNKELQENKQLVESIFGYDVYESMIEFGKKIKEENADLIILIARKAVFFHKILKNIGFDFSPAQIVSDRIIDFEDDFFAGKKIIIVDDSTILGTTANKMVAKLKKKNADEVKFYTFAVDMNYLLDNVQVDYFQRKFGKRTTNNENKEIQSSNELLSFCFNEIKYVSTLSIPYLIDFPVSEVYKCSISEWQQIKETLEQYFRRTILPIHSDYDDVKAFSYYPKENLKNKLKLEVGSQFYEKFIECGKIRLYIQDIGNNELSLKVVPLFLFSPFTNEDSNILFNAIIGKDKEKFKLLQDKKARYRFVQYYLSYCLGTFLLQSCNLKEMLFKSCDKETKNITFGEQISDAIWYLKFQLSQLQTLSLSPQENYDYDTFENVFGNLDYTQDNIDDEVSFEESFANIFKKLFEKEEMRIREERREDTKRLEHGFCLELLYDYYKNTTYFLSNETFDGLTHFEKISDLLDKYNDSGVSVPIICETKDGNACYRAYRHGELALLTEKNLSLYYHFLSKFFEKTDGKESQPLSDIILEKISILFFYFGTRKYFGNIKKSLMCRYDSETKYVNEEGKPYDCVNMGFYRHGAILTNEKNGNKALATSKDYISKTWFYNKDKCPKFLQAISLENATNEAGKIKFIFNKNYEPYPNIPLGRGEIAGAKKIASVLKLIKQQEKYKDFNNIITVLATCPNIESLALAIISLIKIVVNNTDKLFEDLSSIPRNEERHKKLVNSPVYQAINSAYMKYRDGRDFFSYCNDLLLNEKYNNDIYDDVKDFIEKYAESEGGSTTTGEILSSLKKILEKFACIINYLNFLRVYFKSSVTNVDQREKEILFEHNANWANALDKNERLTNIDEIEQLLSNLNKKDENIRIKIQNKINEYLESMMEETEKLEEIYEIKNYLNRMHFYENL
jgi:hypothetical protein